MRRNPNKDGGLADSSLPMLARDGSKESSAAENKGRLIIVASSQSG